MNSKFCQSCGMPMKQDPKNGGTNADGSKSYDFCSYCYEGGAFLGEFKTPQEMQKFCINKMGEQKIPKFIAWLLTRGIPHLKRWKS